MEGNGRQFPQVTDRGSRAGSDLIPMMGPKAKFDFDPGDFRNMPFDMDHFFKFGAFGIAAAFMGLIALLYYFLLLPVFKFGQR
jgi:hypothetical protein